MAGIPGEEADGVMTAVDFLRKVGEQEAYPVQGRAVVIGGGNVAIDVARTAGRCGAESVSMYCLEHAMPCPPLRKKFLRQRMRAFRFTVLGAEGNLHRGRQGHGYRAEKMRFRV